MAGDPGVDARRISDPIRQMRRPVRTYITCEHRVAVPLIAKCSVRRDSALVTDCDKWTHAPGATSQKILLVARGQMQIGANCHAEFLTLHHLVFSPDRNIPNARC